MSADPGVFVGRQRTMEVRGTPQAEEDSLCGEICSTDVLASIKETECKISFCVCERES